MKRFISILAISLILVSCKTTLYHYQVLETTSDNPKIKTEEKQTEYEDDNCRISYDMWENNGSAGFVFYNKTDLPITIDLAKSYFVKNGIAFDYYIDEIISQSNSKTNTNSHSSNSSYYGSYWLYSIHGSSESISSSYQSTIKLPSTITIPPQCAKKILKFEISSNIFRSCDLTIDTQDKTEPIHFDKSNSPLKFANIITYQVENSTPITIRNDFYVNTIYNVISWKFYRYESKKNCDFRGEPKISEKYFSVNPSNGFYIKYVASEYRDVTP